MHHMDHMISQDLRISLSLSLSSIQDQDKRLQALLTACEKLPTANSNNFKWVMLPSILFCSVILFPPLLYSSSLLPYSFLLLLTPIILSSNSLHTFHFLSLSSFNFSFLASSLSLFVFSSSHLLLSWFSTQESPELPYILDQKCFSHLFYSAIITYKYSSSAMLRHITYCSLL